MKFCKYCGSQVSDDAEQCPQCNKYIGVKNLTGDTQQHHNTTLSKRVFTILKDKRVIAFVAVALIVLIVVCFLNSSRCKASGCHNKAASGMSYCYNHKCAVSDCDKKRYSYSNYCYSHYLLYDDDATSSYSSKVYAYQLKISNVELSSNSSYTIAEGTITNNSDQTVSYVKIKGSFTNKSGTVLDTDWTYAVDSEGLEPGESCTWRMSVKKNVSIKECSVSILDFDD